MKELETAYVDLISSGTTRLAYALRVERRDTTVFNFCSGPKNIEIDGEVYRCDPGLNISQIVVTAGLSVDNLELTTLDDGSLFTLADIKNRVWVNAKFAISRYDFNTPTAEPTLLTEAMPAGTFGEVFLRDGMVVVELRGWQQYLQQPMGIQTSETCRVRLFSTKCTVDPASYTVTGALTSVDSNRYFTDSGRTEDDDYFGDGELRFTSGVNAGLEPMKIQYSSSAGVFVMLLPFFTLPEVGDEYEAKAGCRKREIPDCKTKFNNILNFQGEAHVPGLDRLTKPLQ